MGVSGIAIAQRREQSVVGQRRRSGEAVVDRRRWSVKGIGVGEVAARWS